MEKLKLVGTLNYFGVIPDYILPVFKDDNGKFYMAWSEEDPKKAGEKYTIKGFDMFNEEDSSRFKPLSDTDNEMEEVEDYYGIGDIIVQGLEESENKIYLGRIDKFTAHFERFIDTLEEGYIKENFSEGLEVYKTDIKDMDVKTLGTKNRK